MTALFTILFFGILGLFGYALAVYVLKIRNLYAILGFTLSVGSAFFTVISNALGYLMPIRTSFTVTLLLMLVVSLTALFLYLRSFQLSAFSFQLQTPPKRLLILITAVFLLTALAYARDRGSDEWVPTHFAFPALILEGNFPIREMAYPWERTSYHYGYALFVAGIVSATGLSLSHAHAFLPGIAAAGILFFAGAIAWEIRKSWGAATLAGIMTLGAAGFFWLYGFSLLRDLFEHFVNGNTVEPSPFRWLTPAIRNSYAQPLLMMLGHRAIALGGAYLFSMLYCLQHLLASPSCPRRTLPWIITAIVLGAALALNMETTFVLLIAAVCCFSVMVLATSPGQLRRTIAIGAVILLPATLIALMQGGTLSEMSGSTGAGAFTWNLTGRIFHDANIANDSIALWDLRFLRDYGLHLALFLFATLFFWRRRTSTALSVNASLFPLLLFLIATAHFLVPLVLFYPAFPGQLLRFFHVYFSLGSLLIALALWDTLLSDRSSATRRKFGWTLVLLMLIAGTLNAAVRLTFPTLRFERTELFPSMPKADAAQETMFDWVRANTTLDDYFFIHSHENLLEEKDRLIFAFSTGRFVIGWGNHSETTPEKTAHIRAITETCDDTSLSLLSVRYIAVPAARQAAWFEAQCDSGRWVPVYIGGKRYPVVYGRR